MYLSILYFVDEEVVQGAGGTRAPTDREGLVAGMRVKDCLRDSCIGAIFQSSSERRGKVTSRIEVLQQYGDGTDAMSVDLCNKALETLSSHSEGDRLDGVIPHLTQGESICHRILIPRNASSAAAA